MAKEYSKNRSQNASGQFLWLLAGFLSGYLTASFFDMNTAMRWINHTFLNKTQPKPESPLATQPDLPKPKFEFYTLLAKESSSLVPLPKKAPTPISASTADQVKTAPITNQNNKNETYQLQVAAFNKKQDADHLKATLLLKGFNAEIIPVLQGKITWFRVIIGPYYSKGEAEKAQVEIAKTERMKGIIKRTIVG